MALPARWRIIALAAIIVVADGPPLHAENSEIARLRAAQRVHFTDAEILDGFFKTAFGAELRLAGPTDRIRKYAAPVRVAIETQGPSDRRAEVAGLVADIAAHVNHLDIAMAKDAATANVLVHLTRDRTIGRTISAVFGRQYSGRIQRKLDPQCLSGFRKDSTFRIQHSDVVLPIDAGDFVFYDCAYEELLQALGPINDTSTVPWTMFNDDVHKGFFDIYDQYLLNILYDPRVKPGMTAKEVRAVLPQVMPAVRAFIAKSNRPLD